jgi:hypothetical protein
MGWLFQDSDDFDPNLSVGTYAEIGTGTGNADSRRSLSSGRAFTFDGQTVRVVS